MRILKLLIHPFSIICISSFILLNTFVQPGIPQTHDGNNHLARLANFYLAFRDLQIPPRWAPNLNYGFGYPVFNYNYYLAYIPGIVFYSITNSFEVSYKLVTLISMIGLGWFSYLFLKTYTHQWAALTTSILLISSPPYLLQIFVRGNLGDITGWAVFMLGMWGIQKYCQSHVLTIRDITIKPWGHLLAVATLLLLLSHNLIFLLGLPVWILYGFYQTINAKSHLHLRAIISFLFWILLGIGMGAYFLLPSILEAEYTNIFNVALSHHFFDHFVYLKQLFYWPWGYGFSETGLADTMSFMLGVVQWFTLIAALAGVLFTTMPSMRDKTALKNIFNPTALSLTIFLLTIFFITPASIPVWKLLPVMQKIQFPWRLLFLTSITMAVTTGLLLNDLTTAKSKLSKLAPIAIIIAALSQGLIIARPSGMLHQDDYMYLQFPFTSSTQHENLTKGFEMYTNMEFKPQLSDLSQQAQFQIQEWASNRHLYTVTAAQPTTVIEHIMDFPGWITYVDDQKIPIINNLPAYPGIRAYQLQPGAYQVKTIFTEQTYARISGDIVSIISLLYFAATAALQLKTHHHATKIGSRSHPPNH